MGELLVRLEGAQELILEKLVKLGLFKTRSEAIRAGILELGKEYKVLGSIEEIENELVSRKMKKISDEINQGKRKLLSMEEVKKKYGFE